MPVDPIAVFLSSPGDVQAERERAKRACLELQNEPHVRQHFRLDTYAFEDRVPPLIGEQPQHTVDRYMLRPDDADVLVCVLWSRLGSPFTDSSGTHWDSGTAYEFETALQRYRRTGRRPVVLLYRCARPPEPASQEAQFGSVSKFLARFQQEGSGLQGIFHHRSFESTDEFVELLKQDLREVLKGLSSIATPTSQPAPRDILAERVSRMWIESVLTPSLEGRPPIPLPIRVPPGPLLPHGLPEGTYTGIWLKALFRESKRRLVFTARAGGGKTIALLQLLQLLLQDRQAGSSDPIPVVLDATSWKPGQSIRQWCIHELDRLYGVRHSTAVELIDNKQLIYLIDGVDQIGIRSRDLFSNEAQPSDNLSVRAAWAERMHQFIREGDWSITQRVPIVLCCRDEAREEFASLFETGQFQSVCIEEPAKEDVIATVRADQTVPGLAVELERNDQIAKIASVPLFLQMLLSVFRARSPYRPLPSASDEQQIRELISSYVELRLAGDAEEIKKRQFTIPLLRRWLSWLARNQNRSPFLIELMQPDMLPKPDRWNYNLLAAAFMAAALTFCAVIPSAAGLGVEWAEYRGPAVGLQIGLLAGLGITAASFFTSFLVFLLTRSWWFGFWISGVFSLVRGIVVGAGCPDGEIAAGWSVGVQATLFTWLAVAVPWMVYGYFSDYRIDTIHPLSNWNFNIRRGRLALLLGVIVGFVFWLTYGIARGVSFGTMTALLLGGSLCLRRTGLDVPNQPNQAIIRSFNNALTFALVAVLIAVPVVTASYAFQFGWQTGLSNGFLALCSLVAALMFGGLPVLQHAALRLVCWFRGYLPYRLVDFLNTTAELMLIQRVGGAYRFPHDLVRGFFSKSQGATG